ARPVEGAARPGPRIRSRRGREPSAPARAPARPTRRAIRLIPWWAGFGPGPTVLGQPLTPPAGGLLDDGASSVTPGSATAGARRMDVSGWPGGPTLIQRILPSPTSLRTSNPRASRQKPREALGSSCGRVLVWILMSMEVTLRALADARF